ncbi:MAG TPA: hypothetical protein VK071_11635 [Tissierellales bacterium]|nr:hypothetical protein [Tissierellales bacterium]
MDRLYCIYNNRRYSYELIIKMLELAGHEREKGFQNYIDITDNVVEDLF